MTKRTACVLIVSLAVGSIFGVMAGRGASSQPAPVTRTELMRKDLGELDGWEGVMYIAEIAPGAASGRHHHPGDELVYVLEGSGVLEHEGHAPLTVKAGEVFSPPFKKVHDFRNLSQTDRLRVQVVLTTPKGQPLAIQVR